MLLAQIFFRISNKIIVFMVLLKQSQWVNHFYSKPKYRFILIVE